MTQQPQFNYNAHAAYHDPLAPARRASVLLFILGFAMMALSVCNMVRISTISQAQLEAQMKLIQPDQALPFSFQTLRIVTLVIEGVIVLVGLILLALGVPVRSGNPTATTVAMILTGLILLLMLFGLLISLVGLVISPLLGGTMLCTIIIPLVLFGLLFFWLIQAMRAARAAKTATQQYAAQYWQYYQQQQQQPAYGYGPYAPPMTPQQPPMIQPPPQAPVQPPPPSTPSPPSPPSDPIT